MEKEHSICANADNLIVGCVVKVTKFKLFCTSVLKNKYNLFDIFNLVHCLTVTF